jgi:transcriptional regulator NrdR family protein
VLETRQRKADDATTRRYECANLHRFTTEEKPVVKELKRA